VSRFAGHLLVMAAAEGGSEVIEPFLTVIPGRPARYEVRQYRRSDLSVTVMASNLDAASAVRMAINPVPADAAGVEVVSRDDSGLGRCVLGKAGKGRLEFVFPVLDAFEGREEERRLAHRQWLETLDAWAQKGKGAVSAGAAAAAGVPAEVIGAVQAALSQMTVEVDLHEVEDIIRRSVTEGSQPANAGDIARQLASALPKPNELADAVAQKVAALLPRSVTSPVATPSQSAAPAVKAEEIADMVTERMAALLPKLAPGTKLADEIADVVSDKVRELLPASGAPMAAEPGSSGYDRRLGAAILKSLEGLTGELREIREQVRRSRAQLDAATNQSANPNVGQFQTSVERLRRSLSGDMDRLGHQLESKLRGSSGGPSTANPAYDEEFAALSDRLMRSSAHLDRMLVRLDEVLRPQTDGNGSPPPQPRAAGSGQAGVGRARPTARPITRIGP
jgi:hypothetical protein